jgi:hypothetical protein
MSGEKEKKRGDGADIEASDRRFSLQSATFGCTTYFRKPAGKFVLYFWANYSSDWTNLWKQLEPVH